MGIKPGLIRRHHNRNTVMKCSSQNHRMCVRQLTGTVIVLGNGKDVKSGLKKVGQAAVVWHCEFKLSVLIGKGNIILICPAK